MPWDKNMASEKRLFVLFENFHFQLEEVVITIGWATEFCVTNK